ncbi:hypothetical protein D3C84_1242470 [compost metagenome]
MEQNGFGINCACNDYCFNGFLRRALIALEFAGMNIDAVWTARYVRDGNRD